MDTGAKENASLIPVVVAFSGSRLRMRWHKTTSVEKLNVEHGLKLSCAGLRVDSIYSHGHRIATSKSHLDSPEATKHNGCRYLTEGVRCNVYARENIERARNKSFATDDIVPLVVQYTSGRDAMQGRTAISYRNR